MLRMISSMQRLAGCAGAAVVATVSLCALALSSATLCAADAPRERVPFNANWRFQKEDPADAQGKLAYEQVKNWVLATGVALTSGPAAAATVRPQGDPGADVSYVKGEFDDSQWRKLNLPHDWGIEGPFKQEYDGSTGKLPWWGVAWYRKHFTVPSEDKGKQIFLDIDGAMSYSMVWLNGQFVGGWPYGYASYRVDLTPYLKPGVENVIAIRLDNPPSSSRWYPGGGIYRNVWLVKTSPVHVAHWGDFVTTPKVSKGAATVNVRTAIENQSAGEANVKVATKIYALDEAGKPQGDAVAEAEAASVKAPAGGGATSEAELSVKRPKLWSIDKPNRYVAVTTVEQDGKTVDRVESPFGIRTFEFTADNGFLLNGKRVPLNGVCDHHDLGALGAAINTRALERQVQLLKAMGCNAIRTSHNPPAPELLDLCDRYGLVMMDEAFDCWERGKTKNDYHLVFKDWHDKDMRALVRRDRNHPCVVLWSTGNEIPDQGTPRGFQISRELAAITHQEDPTRPAGGGINNQNCGFNGYQNTFDVFGYNYKPEVYGEFRKVNPKLPIIGSETASCISSRGFYTFPVSDNKADGKADFQMSSYDLYAPPWATPPDWEFKGQDRFPFVGGEFVWTGFDYLGEPTPYNRDMTNLLNFQGKKKAKDRAKMEQEMKAMGRVPTPSRSSYFGIIDLAGFPKDRFYIYQARWRPELPMAHILPHWNWPDRVGQVTPVHVYTSGDEAELFLNGKSLGRKKKGEFEYRLRWDDVQYQPGELKVVAYKGGKAWAEATMKTTGPAAKLTLKPDRETIKGDGEDLSFVTAAVADKDGAMVPRSMNAIRFSIEGPGEIVATDNGDATSHVSFQSKEKQAFNGLCLAIVRAKAGEHGQIKLKAEADGLAAAETVIRAE